MHIGIAAILFTLTIFFLLQAEGRSHNSDLDFGGDSKAVSIVRRNADAAAAFNSGGVRKSREARRKSRRRGGRKDDYDDYARFISETENRHGRVNYAWRILPFTDV
uniref:Uncharacterized protein n=1 Tax=Romanomermis culicivorax TaxID=13658 RepID=A0A915JUG4_ROMCU